MAAYTTVVSTAEAEFTEKKSRFLCAVAPVCSEDEAMAFINARKEKYWDCTSTIYAYSLREGQLRRYSDGGEPQGTGGVPVLDVIQKEGLVDVCVVVNRYFGGTKLGTGGLVRAFSHGASIAIAVAQKRTMHPCVQLEMRMDYAQYGILMHLVPNFVCKVLDTEFEAEVLMRVLLKECDEVSFRDEVREATSATVVPSEVGRCYAPIE